MSYFKSPPPDNSPESIWTLIKQLRICDLINAIKQTVLGDFQNLANVARGRELSFETIALLVTEVVNTRTGRATTVTLAVVALVVRIVVLVYPMAVASPLLNGLGFTNVGPAAGSHVAASQPAFDVGVMFSTLHSVAMAGYGVAVVSGVARGVAVAGVVLASTFAAYKMWSGRKHKSS